MKPFDFKSDFSPITSSLASAAIYDYCEGLHSHSQPCVLTSAPKGCNVKFDLTSDWHYICISNSGFRVPYTQTLTEKDIVEESTVRATLHWEQDYPRNREGYCFNPEGLFQPAEQRTEEQGKRVVFQLRGLTGIVSTWTHRERDNRQVERERDEIQRVVDKE